VNKRSDPASAIATKPIFIRLASYRLDETAGQTDYEMPAYWFNEAPPSIASTSTTADPAGKRRNVGFCRWLDTLLRHDPS